MDPLMPFPSRPAPDCGTFESGQSQHPIRGLTLVEVMVAMSLTATISIGFLGSFIQSRRVTEASVMHAAATSLAYGMMEQIKGVSYSSLLPSTVEDTQATAKGFSPPPYVRVRINQDLTVWLKTVYTPAPTAPAAPTTLPSPTATAASLGAIDNVIGPLPLSTASGTSSQALTLTVWLWIDEMPDLSRDVSEVKKVTMIYSYSFNDGTRTRTIRDMEVFLRTRYDE
jgi:hypothetical protein